MRYLTARLMQRPVYAGIFCAVLWITFAFGIAYAFADPRTECPDANPCKVVLITAQEEKILLDDRGILATAAQARSLDLGGLVTYFQQKIAKAPAGEQKEVPKPVAPVDPAPTK